jgi:short-subunit dehydrogenase
MIKTERVAVITGAAQGIGKRTAELLADREYSLYSTICVQPGKL